MEGRSKGRERLGRPRVEIPLSSPACGQSKKARETKTNLHSLVFLGFLFNIADFLRYLLQCVLVG